MSLITLRKNSPTAQRQLDPFYALQTDMNKLFNHFMTDPFADMNPERKSIWTAKTDLKETKDSYILNADLPGFDKKDIDLDFEDNILTLRGERKEEKITDEEKYHHIERSFGSFERRFMLPDNMVDREKIEAKFENGVLTVTLAKKAEVQKESQKITIQ